MRASFGLGPPLAVTIVNNNQMRRRIDTRDGSAWHSGVLSVSGNQVMAIYDAAIDGGGI